jgi:hypothetical protein
LKHLTQEYGLKEDELRIVHNGKTVLRINKENFHLLITQDQTFGCLVTDPGKSGFASVSSFRTWLLQQILPNTQPAQVS